MKADFIEVDDEVQEHHKLKRHLGWFQLVTIGIGAIIGAGIFVITGKAAAVYAGPAIVISFLIASTICIFAGLCYAELSSLIPVAGGSYAYSYVALGELPAWIIGWSVTAQYILSASTVSAGWAGYFTSFLADWGLRIPDAWSTTPLAYDVELGWSATGHICNLPAMIFVLFIGFMISIGIKAAAQLNNVMVIIKLATIALFIVLGIPHIEYANWTPLIPENTGVFGEFGVSGILRAAGLLFFAYIGFDAISTLAQDSKNPQRDLPRGILGSLAICTSAYIAVSLILTGIVSYKYLNVADPIAVALDAMGPNFFWVAAVVKVAILAGLSSVVLVALLSQSRMLMAISSDGLLPKAFSKIHRRFRTPLFTTVVTTLIVSALTGLLPLEILGQLVSMMTLLIFSIVCLGVWVLRHTHPEFERPFRVPFVPVIPFLGIICCVAQMFFLPAVTWLQMILWTCVGLIIYFSYGIKKSKIRKKKKIAKKS